MLKFENIFPDDPTFNPPENVTEYKNRGYHYYKMDGEWVRKMRIRVWCDICQKEKQCFHEIWK